MGGANLCRILQPPNQSRRSLNLMLLRPLPPSQHQIRRPLNTHQQRQPPWQLRRMRTSMETPAKTNRLMGKTNRRAGNAVRVSPGCWRCCSGTMISCRWASGPPHSVRCAIGCWIARRCCPPSMGALRKRSGCGSNCWTVHERKGQRRKGEHHEGHSDAVGVDLFCIFGVYVLLISRWAFLCCWMVVQQLSCGVAWHLHDTYSNKICVGIRLMQHNISLAAKYYILPCPQAPGQSSSRSSRSSSSCRGDDIAAH